MKKFLSFLLVLSLFLGTFFVSCANSVGGDGGGESSANTLSVCIAGGRAAVPSRMASATPYTVTVSLSGEGYEKSKTLRTSDGDVTVTFDKVPIGVLITADLTIKTGGTTLYTGTGSGTTVEGGTVITVTLTKVIGSTVTVGCADDLVAILAKAEKNASITAITYTGSNVLELQNVINAELSSMPAAIPQNNITVTCTAQRTYSENDYCTIYSSIVIPDGSSVMLSDADKVSKFSSSGTINYDLIGSGSLSGGSFTNPTQSMTVSLGSDYTGIAANAFSGCTGLTSITLPASGFTGGIGNSAFKGCSSLTGITLPGGYTGISESAFEDCSSLTSITIPASIIGIGNKAFKNCTSLATVTFECLDYTTNPLATIGTEAFAYCSALTSFTLSLNLSSIGLNAFVGTGLTEAGVSGNTADWQYTREDGGMTGPVPDGMLATTLKQEGFSFTN